MPKKLYKVSNSSIHQRGLFASTKIKEGAEIIQYVGEKISKEESSHRALEWEENAREKGEGLVYIFELDDDWDIDGRVGENPARYINHSCDGNCEAVNCEGEIWISALCDIEKGEELVYDYGYDMEHFLDHPCRCGSKNCIGYIVREDQRQKVKKLLKGKKKKSKKAESRTSKTKKSGKK
jgi:SET domain-containing protein